MHILIADAYTLKAELDLRFLSQARYEVFYLRNRSSILQAIHIHFIVHSTYFGPTSMFRS